MKRLGALVVIMVLVLGAGRVWAATTSGTVNVTATVQGTCQFSVATASLDFGTLTSGDVLGVAANPDLEIWCTSGVTWNVTGEVGLNDTGCTKEHCMNDGAGTMIPYVMNITEMNGTGNGRNAAVALGITGDVLEVDYTAVSAGTYTDTVTVTVTY